MSVQGHKVFFFFFFWPSRLACGIFAPRPGTEHAFPVLEARSLNPWIAREDPQYHTLIAVLRQHGTPETKQI